MTKRIIDVFFAVIGLAAFSPLLLLISILIKLDSSGPSYFRQVRVGQNGQLFKIIKFRTMITDEESLGPKITRDGDKRITKIGRFLRNYKLDEMPQLINVLKGDMSFVGPRPEVPEYVNHYTSTQRRVLDIRPGITDYASIKFKNEEKLLSNARNIEYTYIKEILPEKLNLNLEYVRNRSILLDFKLIFVTLYRIFLS